MTSRRDPFWIPKIVNFDTNLGAETEKNGVREGSEQKNRFLAPFVAAIKGKKSARSGQRGAKGGPGQPCDRGRRNAQGPGATLHPAKAGKKASVRVGFMKRPVPRWGTAYFADFEQFIQTLRAFRQALLDVWMIGLLDDWRGRLIGGTRSIGNNCDMW